MMIGPSISPPQPTSDEELNNAGQALMSLVRSLEKPTRDEEEQSEDGNLKNLIQQLDRLISSTARRGLLRGNQEIAERIVASCNNDSGGKKRGKQRSSGGAMALHIDDGKTSTTTTNASLIVSSIIRILGGQQQQSKGHGEATASWKPLSMLGLEDQCLLILLASDLCGTTSEFVRQQLSRGLSSTCAIAEYELLASNSKPLLAGLARSIDYLLVSTSTGDDRSVQFPIETMKEMGLLALKSCHRAATSLIGLLGNRLTRSSAVVIQLSAVGVWKSLAVMDDSVVESASLLHATLPWACVAGLNRGSTSERASPSEQWNDTLQEAVTMLYMILQAAVPINAGLADRARQHENQIRSSTPKDAVELWLQRIGIADSETERTLVFLHCLNVLVSMITQILSMDALGQHQLISAEVDIVSILDLVEIMMSFPMSAESTYFFKTKKRLRREIFEGGLFSATGMTNMANQIKVMGHRILDVTLSSVREPLLLPFARRLVQSSYTSLLAASSTVLRNVLENKGTSLADKSRKRWLNSSVAVRGVALRSVKQVLLTVGVEPSQTKSRSFRAGNRKVQADNLVNLVCGTLVEQLQWFDHMENADEWGTIEERRDCIVLAAECISSCLVTTGPFLSIVARGLIDSVAKTFMLKCPDLIKCSRVQNPSPLFVAVLGIGTQACSTPWPDGAASSLGRTLRVCATQLLAATGNESVVAAANAACRICDTLDSPRVPALNLVTRTPTSTRNVIADVQTMSNRLKDASAKIEAEDSAETRKSKEDKNERPDVKKPKRNDYHELKKDEEVQESAVPDIQLAPVAIVTKQEKTGKSTASPAATETKDLSEASKAPDRANTQGMKTEVIEAMKTDTPETVVEDEDDDEDIPGIEFDAPPDAEDE